MSVGLSQQPVVPVTPAGSDDLRRAARELDDGLGERSDRGLDAAGDVVVPARLAMLGAGHEAPGGVANEHEIARGARVVDLEVEGNNGWSSDPWTEVHCLARSEDGMAQVWGQRSRRADVERQPALHRRWCRLAT